MHQSNKRRNIKNIFKYIQKNDHRFKCSYFVFFRLNQIERKEGKKFQWLIYVGVLKLKSELFNGQLLSKRAQNRLRLILNL